MDDPTKDMSPFGAALFNCFKSPDPVKQIEALTNLQNNLGSFASDNYLTALNNDTVVQILRDEPIRSSNNESKL